MSITMPDIALQLPTAFGLIFFTLLFVFTVYSWMLGYHWFSYGTSKTTSWRTLVVYLTGAGVLLIVMLLAFLSISASYAG